MPEGVARKRWRRVVMEFDIRIDALEEREREGSLRGETRWQHLPLPEKRVIRGR